MEKIGFVYSQRYLDHYTGAGHPESSDRLIAIVGRLEGVGLLGTLLGIDPRPASEDELLPIHSRAYMDKVRSYCLGGRTVMDDGETGICPESYEVALLAAGGALSAADAVIEGTVRRAFCAVRPPGHHAERDRAMGFCLFNNVAIAARYLQRAHGIGRVLIVDWDVHHGNGTQKAFYDDPDVFYFSIHQWPHYPGTGKATERGEGRGYGYTLNCPVPAGAGDDEYIEVFEKLLAPAARSFNPEFVLISAGFDPCIDDPLSGTSVSSGGFARISQITADIAEESCDGRIISVLEGGYSLGSLSICVEKHIRVLMGEDIQGYDGLR